MLNDNSMSISPKVGALTSYLKELMAGRHYSKLKDDVKKVLHRLPGVGDPMLEVARGLEEGIRQVFTPGSLFEELGFRYVGPINGHSVRGAARRARARPGRSTARCWCTRSRRRARATSTPRTSRSSTTARRPFDPVTGIQKGKSASAPSYTAVFGKALVKLAERDPRIVAITASMPDGTGLAPFSEQVPGPLPRTSASPSSTR